MRMPALFAVIHSRIAAFVRQARADQRGVAALEFALLLPVLLLMYFGSAEVTRAVLATRKLTLATRALSDLLGQQTSSVDDTILTNIFAAASPVMSPFPATSAQFASTLSSINFVAQGSTYIAQTAWTASNSGNTLRPCATLSQISNDAAPSPSGVPVGLYGAGSVVVAESPTNIPRRSTPICGSGSRRRRSRSPARSSTRRATRLRSPTPAAPARLANIADVSARRPGSRLFQADDHVHPRDLHALRRLGQA